ncbi:MAG TPA: 3-phosphoshikimate 1-carboxyvinyltransferase [Candidatus Pullilachnospira gallistercoris]|uniref:3-phosphoshikimate 1-carboxyvinyltransferase n=1 Tax=Candidatus Pullilachnospira gallistercoris TaxID=2840911 RepID=A0A9D1EA75_9FIRM|nr:3-phosphoshikimate 1-carboxyvinyltransferase [Candidatus Pullilachnospira gallistercoris]
MIIKRANSMKGELTVPGDKSISHRGIMFGAIAEGTTELEGFLDGADCRSTISCFRQMGIEISQDHDRVQIHGKGLYGLRQPKDMLDAGNSGTTVRLISGILAGQPFTTQLTGDASIQKRPMKRIMTPLSLMGASIRSLAGNDCAPLEIHGGSLVPIHYDSPVASAQVKSCVLLAGLYAEGQTSVTEPVPSRDHTERMLSGFGAEITSRERTATVTGHPRLIGQHITIPGDISSAAYFIAAGLICPNSDLYIRNVNTNPTRAGILTVAKQMGGKITLENQRVVSGEEVCDIHVVSSDLHGTQIDRELIPSLIDEIPVIAVMAAFAEGTTVIKDAQELKVKESNRIDSVTENLNAMGGDAIPTEDGMIIHGGRPLHGARILTRSDHRIAMSFAIAGLAADGETTFDDPGCIDISYPTFFETLRSVMDSHLID